MKGKMILIVLSVLLTFASLPLTVLGNSGASFSIIQSSEKSAVGQDIRVTVVGNQIKDLYGYELVLTYDAERLRFKSAAAHWTGMSVPAIVRDGEITFAHTKLGKTAGENGTVQIATFAFEALKPGDASIGLKHAKLVNSQVSAESFSSTIKSSIRISAAVVPAAFSDIAGHWAELQVKQASELGFVTGYTDGTFRPDAYVTRAEFTAMLTRAIQLTPQEGVTLDFADLEQIPSWARPFVAEAASAGVITGYEDRTFRASNNINRAEMAVMIARASHLALTSEKKSMFADAEQIPMWAEASVAAAAEAGYINGRSGNRFVPFGSTTRAEAITVILRLL